MREAMVMLSKDEPKLKVVFRPDEVSFFVLADAWGYWRKVLTIGKEDWQKILEFYLSGEKKV